MRITERQIEVLNRLALQTGRCSTSYAGRFPANCSPTYRALRRLESLNLVDREQTHYWPYWAITELGRAALAQSVEKK